MKLPILLLVLAALSQALSVQPVTKRSEAKSLVAKTSTAKIPVAKTSPAKIPVAKSSIAKQKDANQTSKRELYEGNFGERNKELVNKYEVTAGPPPKIEYAQELEDMISEQSPTHQIFGVRLPQIAKISDVLSGHGPSFEAAVAKHLYSPISVYQARLSSPTSFEVPTPAASQSAYSNTKTYKLQADAENEQKLQEVPPKGMEVPSPVIPFYTVNQPRLRFEAYPQPLDSGLPRQHENLPQQIFRSQQAPKKVMSSLFPIYDQLGPFRYPGQLVPSQFLHQNSLYQIVPAGPDFGYGKQEATRDKGYPNQKNHEQLKAGQTNLQTNIPVPKQGYHEHPNGAISFASFSHNLPINTQYETAPQPQPETFHQPQPTQLQSEPIPVQLPRIQPEVVLQSQEQKLAPVKQTIQIPAMLQRLIQDLEKYQPVYQQQPQVIPFEPQLQNQHRKLNALQQHLLFQNSRLLPNPRVIQFQRLPAFKPLPQSQLSPKSFLQPTTLSPVISERSPSYEDQSTQNPENFNLPVEPPSTQLTSLPPLKPNYSKLVKPLEPQSHTTTVFLPTPLQLVPTSTPKQHPVPDQLISSTTVQPNVNYEADPKEQSIQKETQPESQTFQPLKAEITDQSHPTVRPPSIQTTTYLPFVTHEPQSLYFQYSTPQPVYQSTIRPPSPRHDVVIQQQEIQELFFEPSPQPSSTPHYQNQHAQIAPQHERGVHQLRIQPHHQLFEQLQPLLFQQEIQDINSQQYQIEARQSKSLQKLDSSQQRVPIQYLIQQHSHPVQLQHFQPKLLQSQQSELKQSQQQQLVLQAQQQQQHESEQAQQQQVSEQVQQQQQQGSEQAKQQHSQQHMENNNHIQIQISTVKPSQDTEKQTETVEIQQPESQLQLQQQSNLQPITEKLKEQPENSSESTPNVEQPYLGPLLTSSELPIIYAHQQQLVAQPEYSPLLGVPSYSDVQYFGKFAETLFGNHHH